MGVTMFTLPTFIKIDLVLPQKNNPLQVKKSGPLIKEFFKVFRKFCDFLIDFEDFNDFHYLKSHSKTSIKQL